MKKFNLIAWLEENITRFALKTPKFFQIWQTIGTILLVITGIPEALFQLKELFKVDVWQYLPDAVQFVANKTIAIAGLVMLWMSKLPVTPPTTKKEEEKIADKLPFTEKV